MDEKVENAQVLTVVSQDALSLLTKAEIDTQISTAKAFPRSLETFRRQALSMATLTEDIAASCTYTLPRDGKTIDGPSVRLAEIVCASYGNIRAGARVIGNNGKYITAQGFCHDLETNNFIAVEVQRRITTKTGNTFSEDMQVVTGNAACAIAFRNAVYKVVPFAIVDDIWEESKKVARGTVATLAKRRDKALEYFRSLKLNDKPISDKQICDLLSLKKIEDIDLDKLVTLTGMKTAIKNGETTVKDLFEVKAEPATKAEKEKERITKLIDDCKLPQDLEKIKKDVPAELTEYYNTRMELLVNPPAEQEKDGKLKL